METEQSKLKRFDWERFKLMLDIALLAAFLVTTAPQFSGIAIHEWLGIALGVGWVVHLLVNWKWVAAVTLGFFARIPWRVRLLSVIDLLAFISVTVLVFTGLMISEVVLPLAGIRLAREGTWRFLHHSASNAMVILTGLHLATNWSQVVRMVKRWLGLRRPISRQSAQKAGGVISSQEQVPS